MALETEGVPAGPINDLAGVFADPQVIARECASGPKAPRSTGVRQPDRHRWRANGRGDRRTAAFRIEKGAPQRTPPFPLLPKVRRQNFTVPVTKTWRGLP